MSDNWIRLVPDDPRFVPESIRQARAESHFAEISPNAEIEAIVFDTIQFFDCGCNLEEIRCPSCRGEISLDWWHDRMEEDDDQGFKLASYCLPCCNAQLTLNDLVYKWPQAFGRFVLEAMNPNIGMLKEDQKKEFEEILDTPLRVIYQHI